MSDESPEVLHVSQEIVRAENEKAKPVDLVIYIEGQRIIIGRAGFNGNHTTAWVSPDMPPAAKMMLKNVKGEFVFQLPRGTSLMETIEPVAVEDIDQAYEDIVSGAWTALKGEDPAGDDNEA